MSDVSQFISTTLTAAQATVLAGVQGRIADLNAALTSDYQGVFASWAANVTAGRIDNTNPPKPPMAYQVGYFTDMTGSPVPVQWAFPTQGTAPVCAMPPVPGVVTHPTGTMLVGNQIPGAPGWFSACVGDTTPAGTIAPGISQDGISGLFAKVGSVVGGWFQKVG